MKYRKKIIVSVTNDLSGDNRVHKVCGTLTEMGFEIELVGRKLPASGPIASRNYATKRLRLNFTKGPLFYAEYNVRLFIFLLFSRVNVLLANDLDTLPANYLASRVKRKPLVYDSHEYFTEVPELVHRPRVQRFWERLEKRILPKIKYAYTVCDSVAQIYREKYGTPFRVIRNVPRQINIPLSEFRPGDKRKKLILYQGALNIGRGLKQAILAMKHIEDAELVIAGDGDIKRELEQLVQIEDLSGKVHFTGSLPLEKLSTLTLRADLGLSIEEDLGLNYRFALPNKLFDYIQARVPVLVTNLPEMAAIVRKYQVGEITESLEPEILANNINTALLDRKKRKTWRNNLERAAHELVWEKEEIELISIFQQFTGH